MRDLFERWRDRMAGVPTWLLMPGILGCLALLVGGVYLGTAVGKSPAEMVSRTFSVREKGKVVTVDGVRKIRLPGHLVTRNGRTIRLPARTVPYTVDHSSTSLVTVPASTVVRNGTTLTIPAKTLTNTVTNTDTVSGPTTTVTGPGSTIVVTTAVTQTDTQTAVVTTTVTEPGSTVTVTEPTTVTVTATS